jgi:SAM-dependent methyltransferase
MAQAAVPANLSAEDIPPHTRLDWKLFIASFLGLYFELLVIRYVSTELIVFGVLKNLPLIASFFGLGVGMLRAGRVLLARRAFVFVALALFVLARFGGYFPLPSLGWEYGVSLGDHSRVFSVLVFLAFVTAVLWLIVGFFLVLGSLVGEHLDQAPPLSAYGVNLAGSLAGILAFTCLSFLRTPPAVWLAIGFVLLLPFIWRQWTEIAVLAALVAITAIPQPNTYWTPYHRIDIEPVRTAESPTPSAYSLSYNHSWYQTMVDLSPEFVRQHPQAEPNRSVRDYYELPYRFVSKPQDVLVVGAGTGNDVAAALRHGAKHIDAVEIDPVILAMGRRYHPEQPYASAGVTAYVDDARAFFSKSKRKYDLIVFGFLDSSTLLTSFSSLRLDNYVYTRESFDAARRLLKPDGTLVLAFAVTRGYVANRLFVTLTDAFGIEPRAFVIRTNVMGMLYVEGAARSAQLSGVHEATAELRGSSRNAVVATDYWPFLYLEGKSVPMPLLTVILTFVVSAWIWQRRSIRQHLNAAAVEFFFLGAGFLLLETKAVTQLSLLFGSTWVVNAAVISAFLVMALAANMLAARAKLNSQVCYGALLLLLTVGSAVPYSLLSGASMVTKIVAAALWAALPVMFSGVIFSSALKNVPSLATALGVNILGAIVGGMLENAVLLGGSVIVGLIACLVYAAAWACSRRRGARSSSSDKVFVGYTS